MSPSIPVSARALSAVVLVSAMGLLVSLLLGARHQHTVRAHLRRAQRQEQAQARLDAQAEVVMAMHAVLAEPPSCTPVHTAVDVEPVDDPATLTDRVRERAQYTSMPLTALRSLAVQRGVRPGGRRPSVCLKADVVDALLA